MSNRLMKRNDGAVYPYQKLRALRPEFTMMSEEESEAFRAEQRNVFLDGQERIRKARKAAKDIQIEKEEEQNKQIAPELIKDIDKMTAEEIREYLESKDDKKVEEVTVEDEVVDTEDSSNDGEDIVNADISDEEIEAEKEEQDKYQAIPRVTKSRVKVFGQEKLIRYLFQEFGIVKNEDTPKDELIKIINKEYDKEKAAERASKRSNKQSQN